MEKNKEKRIIQAIKRILDFSKISVSENSKIGCSYNEKKNAVEDKALLPGVLLTQRDVFGGIVFVYFGKHGIEML